MLLLVRGVWVTALRTPTQGHEPDTTDAMMSQRPTGDRVAC